LALKVELDKFSPMTSSAGADYTGFSTLVVTVVVAEFSEILVA
jgi:hypothetical protein